MAGEDISFRPATPEDVEAAVPLIYSSGPAAFDFVFAQDRPNGAQDFLRHAFRQGGGEFGWRNHVAGVAEGRVVAIGAGWDGRQSIAFTLAAARQIFGFFGPIKAWGVIIRGLKVESVIRPAGAGEFYVGHLGVDPAMRSRGLGAKLMTYLLALATACPKALLDVDAGNPRAQALYERLGFVVTATRVSKLHSRYDRVGDHRRMEKPLP